MSLAEQYVDGVREELKYWATWGPGTHLSLGDCGPVVDGVFRREANVRDWDIDFDDTASPSNEDWSFNSDKNAEVTFQAQAENQKIPEIPQGTAGISIKFKNDQAAVLAIKGSNQGSIDNVHRLKQQVLAKGKEDGPDAFPENFAVITDLVTADATTVLVEHASGGEYVASAKADLKAGLVDLANASLGLSVAHSKNVKTELEATANATPLFRGFRLKRSWWIWLQTKPLEAVRGEAEEELPFDDDPRGTD